MKHKLILLMSMLTIGLFSCTTVQELPPGAQLQAAQASFESSVHVLNELKESKLLIGEDLEQAKLYVKTANKFLKLWETSVKEDLELKRPVRPRPDLSRVVQEALTSLIEYKARLNNQGAARNGPSNHKINNKLSRSGHRCFYRDSQISQKSGTRRENKCRRDRRLSHQNRQRC